MLSLDQQKRLTEFLGERPAHGPVVYTTPSWQESECSVCGTHVVAWAQIPCRLDFSDWRVAGRILEQATHVGLCPSLLFDDDGHWQLSLSGIAGIGHSFSSPHIEDDWYATPQEAIGQAIDAYLAKGEGK